MGCYSDGVEDYRHDGSRFRVSSRRGVCFVVGIGMIPICEGESSEEDTIPTDALGCL